MVHRRVGKLRVYQRRRYIKSWCRPRKDDTILSLICELLRCVLSVLSASHYLLSGTPSSASPVPRITCCQGLRARLHQVPVNSAAPRATPVDRPVRWQFALRSTPHRFSISAGPASYTVQYELYMYSRGGLDLILRVRSDLASAHKSINQGIPPTIQAS